jgi:rsbT co-antagonist protein RsbR
MSAPELTKISELLQENEQEILSEWLRDQMGPGVFRSSVPRETDLEEQSKNILRSLREALSDGAGGDISGPQWSTVRENLAAASLDLAVQGFSPAETAASLLSLKQPIFLRLIKASSGDELARQIWALSNLVDKLAQHTIEVHQKGREQVIARQQQEMMELSTPVVELWRGILALPLIGTLDSQRTQVVMENLLQKIVDTGAPIAIIDITGVPTVDTLVAQHLLKTVSAARLMGADCIISGIRPQIAQTIVHLGVELNNVITKATLADAFSIALKRAGLAVVRQPAV